MNNNTKENDWLLNLASNPTFSIANFRDVGLNASNTSLADENTYKNIPQIQSNPEFQTDGKFDEAKFHSIYQVAAETYNKLADETYQEDVIKQATFHRDNIFVDPSQRRKGPELQIVKQDNPLRQKRGIRRLNLLDNPTQSIDEIAQTQKVWDGATKTWHDSPNDSFWTDFWDTRVMAQWDFDADKDGNPTNDEAKKVFKKGDLKLNENGTYYYENLNGRDVYGRRVLSKLNTLTTDGSAMNKYDFFDSDDLDKSVGGTFMKNAATIAPMFVPYVGAWYVGAGIATEVAKIGAVLGKMFTGSNSPFLSAVEGFVQSLEPTSSQYAQDHAWSVENLLNLTGDVFKQLYEQRWLFKYAPAMFKGKAGMTEGSQLAQQAKWAEEYRTASIKDLLYSSKVKPTQTARALKELEAVNLVKAQARMEEYMKDYNKIGSLISKAYMTGITVQNAYGEAKQQGASDIEAAMLTLGYAAGEYAIINSRLGEWILPELRMEKEQWKQIARTLTNASQKVTSNTPKEQKVQFMKKLFNMGKDIAQANYSVGKAGMKATVANAIGEGVEEVSEEFLYDFAKSVSNLGSWLAGSPTNLTAWDDMGDRYGLSFVGGVIGGGAFQALPDIREARKLKNLSHNQAYQQLVYMARNGQMVDFLKQADKITLGNKYLSATKQTTSADGTITWAQGTDSDNQDVAAKRELRRQAEMITNILKANGADISDESFLNIQTLKDLRFSALTKSSMASLYLQDYNTLCAQIIDYTNQINNLNSTATRMEAGTTDKSVRENGEDPSIQAQRSNLEALLKEALEKKESYLNGDRAPEYIKAATFEMSPALNKAFVATTYIAYTEAASGKKIEELSQSERDYYQVEYQDYISTQRRDDIHQAFMIFNTMGEQTSQLFADHSMRYYESFDEVVNQSLSTLQKTLNNTLSQLNNIEDSENFMDRTTAFISGKASNAAIAMIGAIGTAFDVDTFNEISMTPLSETYTEKDLNDDIAKFLSDFVYTRLSDITQPIVNQGYINPEIKGVLAETLRMAENFFVQMELNSFSEDAVNYAVAQTKIQQAASEIEKLPHSPITEILDKFTLSVTDSNIRFTKLLADLENQLVNKLEDISTFDISQDINTQIKEALRVSNAAKSMVLAARTDASLDNIYGYNSMVNETLRPEIPLAEINAPVADAMMQDIETVEQRLKFFQRLSAVNNEQKLNEQSKTATNKDYILYRKLVRFADSVPDTWNGKNEFKTALNNLTAFKELSSLNKLSLTAEEKAQIEGERIAAEDAIHTFFKANASSVSDPSQLALVINTKNFNIYSNNDEILDSTSKDIDDNSFIWYLASRAAVKSTDFYNQYKTIISDRIAPIPTQELAAYLGYTSIVNGTIIDNFVDAVNQSIQNDWKTLSPEEKRNISIRINPTLNWDFALDSAIAPRFSRVTFIEGIPGSGKTTGVFETIVTLLKKYHPEVLDRVWVGHATSESAIGLSKSLNLEDAKTISSDKEGMMKKISSDWHEARDANGDIDISDNMFTIDENNVLRSAFNVNEISSPPTIIFIDEVSRYTTFDLDLIERFAKKYGVPIIVAGDFDQTRVVGKHQIEWNGQKATNHVQLYRNNFVRTPKLGVSMRTNNSQKSFNLKLIRSQLAQLKNNELPSVPLHYFQDESGLYGDKSYDSYSYDLALVKADIDLMLGTLEEGQKIGYIYSNTTSDLYNLLSSATYKDKINWHEGTSAQGLEGQYYIIEPNVTAQPEQYWSDLYTGITRAMQGSIIVTPEESYTVSAAIESIQDTSTNREELSKEQVKKFSETRKALLAQVVPTGNPITIVPREQDSSIIGVKPPEAAPGGLVSEEVSTTDDDGNPDVEIITNNGLPSEEELREQVHASSQDSNPPPAPTVFETHTPTGARKSLALPLYSFATFETGWVRDKDGNLTPGRWADDRIDSFNGLSKLDSLLDSMKTPEEMDILLGQIRSTIFEESDKAQLLTKIKSILNINTPVYGTFAIKSSAGEANNPNFGRFSKSPSESLEHIYATDSRSKEVKKKSLVLIIGQTVNGVNKDVLEIPLLTMASPLTVMKMPGFESIKEVYDAITIADPSLPLHKKTDALLRTLQASNDISNAEEFAKLLEVWKFEQNAIFFIDDPNWTIHNQFETTGPSVVNRAKGQDYEVEGLTFDGQWIELGELSKMPGRHVSRVMISPRGTYTDGESRVITIAKPGHPFVLVTDSTTLRGDALKEYYYRQESNPAMEKKVKLVYVAPPKASFEDYFSNLKAIITKDGTPKNIGNDFTAYRILSILMRQPGFENSDLNYLKDSYEGIMRIVDRISNTDTVAKQMEILKEPVDIQGMNANIDAQQALQNYLFRMVYPSKFGGGVVFKPEILRSIEHILGQNKIDGVFYNVRYDKNSKDTTMVDAMTTDMYSMDGIPFMVNGKIDSQTFYGTVDTLVDTVLSKIRRERGMVYSTDNHAYRVNKNSSVDSPARSDLDIILESPTLAIDSSAALEVRREFGNSQSVQESEVIEFLKRNGHMVLPINGVQYVSQKNNLFSGTESVISNIVPISMNLYKFDLTLGSETYNGEFDSENREASLVKVNHNPAPPVSAEVGTITLVDDAELATYLSALRTISIGHAKFKALKLATTVEEFNAAVNDLPASKAILSKVTQELDNFDAGPQKDALQSIIDLLQAKMDMKNTLEQTDESCPVVIKINF